MHTGLAGEDKTRKMEATDVAEWEDARKFLKKAVLEGKIPVDSSQMKPKQVWERFKDAPALQCLNYGDKNILEKFTRMIHALQKKHKDGDLIIEQDEKPIE